MIKTLEPQEIDLELQDGHEPFLVAFLKRNDRYRGQHQTLDEISKKRTQAALLSL